MIRFLSAFLQFSSVFCTAPRLARVFFGVLGATFLALAVVTKPAITIGGALAGLVAVIAALRDRTLHGLSRLTTASCAAVLVMVSLSAFWGADPHDSYHHTLRWLLVFPLGLAMIAFARRVPVLPSPKVWGWFIAALGFGAVYTLFSDATDYGLQHFFYPYDSFEPTDFNKTLAALVMLTPALLYPWWVQGGRYRQMAVGVAGLVAVTALSSYSQAAGLAVLILVLSTVVPVRSRRFWRVVRVVTVAGVLGLPWAMPYAYHHWAAPLKASAWGQVASGAERLEIWAAVSDEIAKKPWLGHGYNAGRVIEFTTLKKVYFWDQMIAHTHNFVLQAWLEFGVMGAGLLAVFLVLMWRRIQGVEDRRARRMYFMTAAATIGMALVGWNLWQTWWIVLLFLTATTAILSARLVAATPILPKS